MSGNRNYPYDSQFVIRFPVHWNRKLVVTSAPGLRAQYANDLIISDFVLDKGYAFASTDKGNSGLRFYSADQTPGEAVLEWHRRINQLTEASKDAAETYYGESPNRTYITGNSNAGYVTRYALENHPDLYDGGVDWQGPLWLPEEPNLLTFIPVALKNYPRYIDPCISDKGRDDAHNKMIDTGFPGKKAADSRDNEKEKKFFDALWDYHYKYYWGSTEGVFREEFDPYYLGAEVDYKYVERINPPPQAPELLQKQAQAIKNAVAKISLTGNIGKPLITLHGTLDTLLPITQSSDKYADLIDQKDKAYLHRYYQIEGGTHVDSLYDYYDPDPEITRKFREKLRPMLPCYRASFELLERWVEEGRRPSERKQWVPRPKEGDIVNECPTLEKVLT